MMPFLKKIWRAEPVVVGLLGHVAFWPTVFLGASMAGHPIDPNTQALLVKVSALLTAIAVRQTVTAPDTLDAQLGAIKSINEKAGV